MQQSKQAVLSMGLLAALLAGFGIWQFGGIGLGGGKSEHGEVHELDAEQRVRLERIAAEQGGRIVEIEREREDGREVYELKIIDANGKQRELLVDVSSGALVGNK